MRKSNTIGAEWTIGTGLRLETTIKKIAKKTKKNQRHLHTRDVRRLGDAQ